MTPSWGGSGLSMGQGQGARPSKARVAVILGVLAVALVLAKGCQDSQVRITQERAVETARDQIDFKPTLTQVRLLRQGLTRKPFWFVSLSIPIGDEDAPDGYRRLAVVEVDARTGEVESVKAQDPAQDVKAVVRVSQADAIGTAEDEINFVPRRTGVRLRRQGADRDPFWLVSFTDADGEVTAVEVDANSGEATDVRGP